MTEKISKLSIVTICRNEEKRIEYTIQSVINQSFKDYQYIVIDGASTDQTTEIIKKYQGEIDIFISEPDKGIYNAMNKAIDYCTGEYIFFLNGGDIIFEQSTLEKILSHKLKADLIYGNIGIKEQNGKRWILEMPPKLTKPYLLKKTIPHQATFTRKMLFDKIGKYDESFRIAADYKLSLKAICLYNCSVQYIPEVFSLFDRCGVGFMKPELRKKEKKKIQNQLFNKKTIISLKIQRNKYFKKLKYIVEKILSV